MDERKYKHRKAIKTQEHIEAIYEDLTYSTKKEYTINNTLKDYISDILSTLKLNNINRELKKSREEYLVNSSLMLLAIFSILIILLSRGNEWPWFSDYQYSAKLFGIVLSFIYIGISIEKTSFFKTVWRFGFTKFIISVSISALIIFCTSKASELINLVFNVDASAFPYTRAYIIGLLVFQYASPFLIIIAGFSILHSFNIWHYIQYWIKKKDNYEEFPASSITFLILSIILLYFSYQWVKHDFSEKEYPSKIYRLAHTLDFNAKHPCVNLNKYTKVIFLDSLYKQVLVDESDIQTKSIESIINKDMSRTYIPKKFNIVSCKLE